MAWCRVKDNVIKICLCWQNRIGMLLFQIFQQATKLSIVIANSLITKSLCMGKQKFEVKKKPLAPFEIAASSSSLDEIWDFVKAGIFRKGGQSKKCIYYEMTFELSFREE